MRNRLVYPPSINIIAGTVGRKSNMDRVKFPGKAPNGNSQGLTPFMPNESSLSRTKPKRRALQSAPVPSNAALAFADPDLSFGDFGTEGLTNVGGGPSIGAGSAGPCDVSPTGNATDFAVQPPSQREIMSDNGIGVVVAEALATVGRSPSYGAGSVGPSNFQPSGHSTNFAVQPPSQAEIVNENVSGVILADGRRDGRLRLYDSNQHFRSFLEIRDAFYRRYSHPPRQLNVESAPFVPASGPESSSLTIVATGESGNNNAVASNNSPALRSNSLQSWERTTQNRSLNGETVVMRLVPTAPFLTRQQTTPSVIDNRVSRNIHIDSSFSSKPSYTDLIGTGRPIRTVPTDIEVPNLTGRNPSILEYPKQPIRGLGSAILHNVDENGEDESFVRLPLLAPRPQRLSPLLLEPLTDTEAEGETYEFMSYEEGTEWAHAMTDLNHIVPREKRSHRIHLANPVTYSRRDLSVMWADEMPGIAPMLRDYLTAAYPPQKEEVSVQVQKPTESAQEIEARELRAEQERNARIATHKLNDGLRRNPNSDIYVPRIIQQYEENVFAPAAAHNTALWEFHQTERYHRGENWADQRQFQAQAGNWHEKRQMNGGRPNRAPTMRNRMIGPGPQ